MTDSLSAGTVDAAFKTCLEQAAARERLAVPARAANKATLFDALALAGITTVIVEFDGSGDEGQIESMTAYVGEAAVDLPPGLLAIREPRRDGAEYDVRTCPVAEVIETLAYDLLTETCGGWQDSDGAYGEFHFDVAARTLRLELSERVMETIYSEHVF